MEYMVMYILDDPVLMEDLIGAWVDGGVRGATIIESTGMYRLQRKLIPMQYLYSSNKTGEKDNITIMAIVKDQVTAEKCLEITESVVGDLDHPNTGIFAAWPLGIVKGLHRHSRSDDM